MKHETLVGENYCFIYAELFQYTISDGESQTPNFPEGKGGEEGGGGESAHRLVYEQSYGHLRLLP